MKPRDPHASRLFGLNLMLFGASILISLAVAELLLRLVGFASPAFFRPDERLGMRLSPGAEGPFQSEGHAYVRINSAGFRDQERTIDKPAGTYRIGVLGDSMTEALQVDADKVFSAVLERELSRCARFAGKRVEVLNFGVSGYGTAQQLLTYRLFASKYSPDLVLLAFFPGNDVRNNSKELEPEKTRPFFVLRGSELVEDDSFSRSEEFQRRTNTLRAVLDRLRFLRIVQAAYFAKDRIEAAWAARAARATEQGREAGLDDAVYGEPRDDTWRAAWAVTDALVRKLASEARADGAELAVVTIPPAVQAHPDPAARRAFLAKTGLSDLSFPDWRLSRVTAEIGVRFVPLAPAFAETAQQKKVYLHGFPNTALGTGHLNERGHQLAGEVIASELCR